MPPSAPRLVIVMVEPVSSSLRALPVLVFFRHLAQFPGALPQIQGFNVPDHWHHQAVTGLHRNTDVDRIELRDDLALIVKVCITLGKFICYLHQGLHDERQVGEFRPVFPAASHLAAGAVVPGR